MHVTHHLDAVSVLGATDSGLNLERCLCCLIMPGPDSSALITQHLDAVSVLDIVINIIINFRQALYLVHEISALNYDQGTAQRCPQTQHRVMIQRTRLGVLEPIGVEFIDVQQAYALPPPFACWRVPDP